MRRWFTSLLVAALLLTVSFPAGAAEMPPFSIALTADEGRCGSVFDLTLSYNGALGPLGVFVLRVDFDPACLTCQRVDFEEGLQENYTASAAPSEGQVAVAYTQKSEALAYGEPGTAVTYRFQVREDAAQGQTKLRVRVEQVVSPQGESLCQDIEETLSYEILGPISSHAALQSLEPSAGEFDQPFSPDQLFYTMSVPYSVDAITFTAVPVDGATFRVNRKNLGAGGSETEFQITVTAADGKTKQVYQVNVYREALSADASLLHLAPDVGEFDQEFSPDQFFYTMNVPYSVDAVTFTAVPIDGATFRVNRKNLGAGGSETEFQITVTAADGTTKQVYQVNVYREALSADASLLHLAPDVGEFDQEFSPDQFFYTMNVPYSVDAITFTAVPIDGATFRVNRKNLGAGGSETEFQITVTAADGKTKQVYQVNVYREALRADASLLHLAPDVGELDQEFSPGKMDYTMSVPHEVTALTFTAEPAEGAKCRVNRTNLGAAGSETEFEITVTAEDGKTKQIYRVTVYREMASGEALLTALAPDTGELEQEFSPERFYYTMRVPYGTTAVTFTAVPVEGAACKVNRTNLGAGGSTTSFEITVTAADRQSKQVYQVDVYREEKDPASGDATLLSLEPDTGSLDQPFSPDEFDYTMTVPFSVKSMTFQTEPAEGATCRVNRKNLGAGGSDTEFQFTVTAADKETKQVYRVIVHREEQAVSVTTSSPAAGSKTTAGTAISTAAGTAKTKTPQPSASPSPSPMGVPVPVEEDSGEASAESGPELAIDDLPPEGVAAEEGTSPFVYVTFAGVAAIAVCLSGPVARWAERRTAKKTPKAPKDGKQ